MIDQKKRMYQSEALSLLTLKLILTEAKKESPPQTWREQSDANDELALKLIAGMKKKYRKGMSLRGAFAATKQPPGQFGDCFVGLRPPRNDIEIEP